MLKIKSQKTQFKIQQMAFMLFAITLFFILVALFWLAIQQRNIINVAKEMRENQAVLLSKAIIGNSEFNCERELGSYCIDTDKIMVLKDKQAYKEFWPVSFIKIRKIYPPLEKEVVCNKANYPDCNIFELFNHSAEGSGVGSFVALCRYDLVEGYPTRICELGKVIIGYEV